MMKKQGGRTHGARVSSSLGGANTAGKLCFFDQQRPLVEARAALNTGVVKEDVTRPTSTTTTTTRNKTPLSSFHLFDQGEDENENNEKQQHRLPHRRAHRRVVRNRSGGTSVLHFRAQKLPSAVKPKGASDVSVDSLIYLKLLDEIPDVVLFGTGKQTKQIPEDSVRWAREMGMAEGHGYRELRGDA